ncbi:MAG: hypothetical protein JOZ62_00720 [Acidobacteriaceae bacterium]|nr:hypothetical protein [Acidobacteriaceae bacterium]
MVKEGTTVSRRETLGMLSGGAFVTAGAKETSAAPVLNAALFQPYVKYFNEMVSEDVVNYVPNAHAWEWMRDNIPYFSCPDKNVEETYYYRWWAYRKAIKQTQKGFIVTEFLKPVRHATEYNAISSAFGHHLAEGRWVNDPKYMDDYTLFWLKSGADGGLQPRFHQFSGWAAAAVYDRWLVNGDTRFLTSLFDPLTVDYRTWEDDRELANGLFWQTDVADGMEESISGGRKVRNLRPSINSYMYGNAVALSAIATLISNSGAADEYSSKATKLKHLVEQTLWNNDAGFFETVLESGTPANVREEIGFTPWYFDLPEANRGYEPAWRQLMDSQGFYAPYGPTTAEQRDPRCRILYSGDDCQWNGPSWPFATTITLRALANVLNDYKQNSVTMEDYFATFLIYTRSHVLMLPDGRTIPWIDENLNPFTGEWLARRRKIDAGTFYGRGDHYNHSGYADLLITGLVGLRPKAGDTLEVNPLLPAKKWDWFCLDHVRYRGRLLTVLWDKTGGRFGRDQGLNVYADGRQVAHSSELGRISARLL